MGSRQFLAALALASIAAPCGAQGPERGFTVREVIAEAGMHPNPPSADARKGQSDEGHAYWLKPDPVVTGGIVDVGMEKGLDGWIVWLSVNDADAKQMREFTSAHLGTQFALMLDGQIVGEPMKIMGTLSGRRWQLAETGRVVAFARCLDFDKARAQPGQQLERNRIGVSFAATVALNAECLQTAGEPTCATHPLADCEPPA